MHDPAAIQDDLPADVILRSSDQVDLQARRRLLADASPIFNDVFSLPQPDENAAGHANAMPVVDLEEDSKTLRVLLDLCRRPDPDLIRRDATLIGSVLRAAIKYEMNDVVETAIKPLSDTMPFAVYAHAVQLGLDELAKHAARCSLACVIPNKKVQLGADMSDYAYTVLYRYHKRCSEVAGKLAESCNFAWLPDRDWTWFTVNGHACTPHHGAFLLGRGTNWRFSSRQWWWDWLTELQADTNERPSGKMLLKNYMDPPITEEMGRCLRCRLPADKEMRQFVEDYAAQVDIVTSKVELVL